MEKFNKSMVGKKVRFINKTKHGIAPSYYPPMGTIGIIRPYYDSFVVEWPKGSVEHNGRCFFCDENDLEIVEEEANHMTDKEIFQMLRLKLNKNDVYEPMFETDCGLTHEYGFYSDDVIKVVALAYRSGYNRGKKGRPFKIGGDANC